MTDEVKKEGAARDTQSTGERSANEVASANASAMSVEDQRETVRRVLRALFNETDGAMAVKSLRDALFTSTEAANAVLTSLNVKDGAATDPRFNNEQRRGLKALLSEMRYAPISPIGPYSQPELRNRISQDALRFWRELLSKEPGAVEDFHLRISDYTTAPGDAAKLERVLVTMRAFAPGVAWDRRHADALAALNTRSLEFKGLAWYHFVSDIW